MSREVLIDEKVCRPCSTCKRPLITKDVKFCSKCGVAIYCSQACQKSAWPQHKSHCSAPENIQGQRIAFKIASCLQKIMSNGAKKEELIDCICRQYGRDKQLTIGYFGPPDVTMKALHGYLNSAVTAFNTISQKNNDLVGTIRICNVKTLEDLLVIGIEDRTSNDPRVMFKTLIRLNNRDPDYLYPVELAGFREAYCSRRTF